MIALMELLIGPCAKQEGLPALTRDLEHFGRIPRLMWSQTDSGEGIDREGALAWVQAKNTNNYLGHSDLSLPDIKELQSIVDYGRSPATTNSAAIDPAFASTSIANEGVTDRLWMLLVIDDAARLRPRCGKRGRIYQLRPCHGQDGRYLDGRARSRLPAERPQGDAIRIDNFVRLVSNAQKGCDVAMPQCQTQHS